MSTETIGYSPIVTAEMPDIRQEKHLLSNLAPGKLPTELDNALSTAVIENMNK